MSNAKKLSVYIATPSGRGLVHWHHMRSVIALMTELSARGHEVNHGILTGSNVALFRNRFCDEAIRNNCTTLLMIDDDMAFSAGKIADMVERPEPFIAASYAKRVYDPDLYTVNGKIGLGEAIRRTAVPNHLPDPDQGEVSEVDLIGTAIFKIDIQELLTVPVDKVTFSGQELREYFYWGKTPKGEYLGEDFAFCHLLRQNG
ncbi:hypothetical protein, partial [Ruegeria sp. ANG-R]|uniref:hypothetical protein n=1 Tax=Ruegeria sp. ANG-R TaxID=1577903 RepID=UPI001269B2B4